MKTFTILALCAASAMTAGAQSVIFQDDFSWLTPWTTNVMNQNGTEVTVGNTIGDKDINANCVRIDQLFVDGKSAAEEAADRGYEFLVQYKNTLDARSGAATVYLQRTTNSSDEANGAYLKFGLTGYAAGLTFPELANLPKDGATGVKVSFEWCPMMSGAGKFDTTHLSVLVNGSTTEGNGRVNIPDHTIANDIENMKWYPAEADFEDFAFQNGDKITIRPGKNQWPGGATAAFRWFIRNVKVTTGSDISTGFADIEVDDNAPEVYYNLQGLRVENPKNGLYIVRKGNKVSKKIFR